MLQLVIEELEDHGQYDYLVCQAWALMRSGFDFAPCSHPSR